MGLGIVLYGNPGQLGLFEEGLVGECIVAGPAAPRLAGPGGPGTGPLDVIAAVASRAAVATQLQIDTGSTFTSVDQALAASLGGTQVGTETVQTVNTTLTDPVEGGLTLWTPAGFDLSTGLTGELGVQLPAPTQVLLGMNTLAQFELLLDGPGGTWALLSPGAAAAMRRRALWTGIGLAVAGTGLVAAAAWGLAAAARARRAAARPTRLAPLPSPPVYSIPRRRSA